MNYYYKFKLLFWCTGDIIRSLLRLMNISLKNRWTRKFVSSDYTLKNLCSKIIKLLVNKNVKNFNKESSEKTSSLRFFCKQRILKVWINLLRKRRKLFLKYSFGPSSRITSLVIWLRCMRFKLIMSNINSFLNAGRVAANDSCHAILCWRCV